MEAAQLLLVVVDTVCTCLLLYTRLLADQLEECGFYQRGEGGGGEPAFTVTDKVCITINDVHEALYKLQVGENGMQYANYTSNGQPSHPPSPSVPAHSLCVTRNQCL